MKSLIFAILTASCFASPILYSDRDAFTLATAANPIAPTVSGAAQYIGAGAYYLSLKNAICCDQTVTLTFSQPLIAFGALFDNRPMQPGTGILESAGGSTIGPFGDGQEFLGFVGVLFDEPVTKLTLSTLEAHFANGLPRIEEHLLMWDLVGTPIGVVPEAPGWILMGIGLFALWFWSMCKAASRKPPIPGGGR